MKWFILIISILLSQMTVYAEEPKDLYAQSAVLMDAESGRVLFGKNEKDQKAMASTTKIMTCILALENGELNDVVTFSKYAASQPKVHLGVSEGKQFYLKDLLYSLMLESHNDSAVAIAEHIAGSVEAFADLMNQKALELGCDHTHYVTPNGLDSSDEEGNHVTTASELATVMCYCINGSEMADEFLEITQTPFYSFTDVEKKQTYTCNNRNSFLTMMDGAISGKTGYTSKAGYCYVGALERDGKTFVVALLACGWPNHKNYKWSDTVELMEYALETYEYREVYQEMELSEVSVKNGVKNDEALYEDAKVKVQVDKDDKDEFKMLLGKEEKVDVFADYKEILEAPVYVGEQIGTVTYYLNEKYIREYPIIVSESVYEKDMRWYFIKLVDYYINNKMA